MEELKSTMLQDPQQSVFFNVDDENYVKVDMTLPMQMLFDDVLSFVSVVEI